MEISAELVRSLLDYCPSTGVFKWKKQKGRARKGDIAGHTCQRKEGYRWVQIRVNGRLYTAHRLAWLHTYGSLPNKEIDHINHDPTDNRLCNLRLVSHADNSRNQPMRCTNTSGVTGVSWCKTAQKWRAEVKKDGKKIRLGRFADIQDAEKAVITFRLNNGFHPNHGTKRRFAEA